VLKLAFTPRDLTRVRFAFSPLWEVVASVRVLKNPTDHPVHQPWTRQARGMLAGSGLDWGMLSDLVPVPTRVIAGFISPPPPIPVPDLELELCALRATPAGLVRATLDGTPGPRPPGLDLLLADPVAGLRRLARIIRQYWDLVLEPYWPRMLRLFEGDVLYRARRLIDGGTDLLFADFDTQVGWDGHTLSVANENFTRSVRLGGRGLLLVPSVFAWPRVFAKLDGPGQPTLRYPPRGVARLWERDGADLPRGLAAVLGRSRALILSELDSPASTTDLARRTGLSAGGVSQHLTALRHAGLVNAYRVGRFVLYARTMVAESLLSGQSNPVPFESPVPAMPVVPPRGETG
jgi:DNA-binding transcriptional ArsR family regulator